jgi:hypothetical protein
MTEIAQPSFASGELSPSLHSRVDLARYYTSLRTCRNWIVRPTGGVVNRPGTVFVASAKYPDKACRLIEFRFNSAQTYVLEFGHLYLRVFYRGAPVVYPEGHEDAGEVVEVVTIWPEGALEDLSVTQDADVMTVCHIGYPTQQLGRYDHHDWRLSAFANVEGPFQELNVDTTKTVYANGYTGNITITASVGIFTAGMIGQMIKIEQAPDSMTKRWEVQKAVQINDVRKGDVSYYMAVNAGTTGTVRPSILEGVEADGDPGVTWRYLHSGFGIVKITGFTSSTVVTGTVLLRLPDSVVSGGLSRTITNVVAGAAEVPEDPGPYFPAYNARVTCPAHGFSTGDSVTISGVTGMAGINGIAQVIVIDANTFDLSGIYGSGAYAGGGTGIKTLAGTNTYKWAIEAWGGDQGYPATSGYYQQRQIFGGTPAKAHEVHMSRSAGFTDFGQSNPILDDDAITFSLNSGSVGQILHFVGLKQLIALTSEGPWIINKEQGKPVPATDPQGEGGAGRIAPLKVGKQALYVEEMGGIIRALGYEFSSDTYEGKDLTITADHLFAGRSVVSWAYQKVPFRCVWIVFDDGEMAGLTYMPEQEVLAWHRHDTDGFFESVYCIPEDRETAVYVSVRRTIGGVDKRYVERFASRTFATMSDVFIVDSGLTYDGRGAGTDDVWTLSDGVNWTYQESLTFTTELDCFVGESDVGDVIVITEPATGEKIRLRILEYIAPDAVVVLPSRTIPVALRDTPYPSFDIARGTFTGLGHLEGKTVSILADGNTAPPAVVTGGSVSILQPAVVAHVGLQIIADLETLDVNAQGRSSQDRMKNINSVSLMVKDTRGLLAGPDEDHLLESRAEISGTYDHFYQEQNGIMTINILSNWTKGGRVFIRQEDPLAAMVLAIIPQVVTGGT